MSQWQESFLNEIVQIIGGGTPKTTVDGYWFGDIPWLSVVDFGNDNRWVSKTEKSITERGLKNSSTQLLDTGDLILSARGTVGEIAQLTKPMAFNQSCYGLKAKTPLSNNFLYYLIKYNLLKLKRNTHGSVFSTITRETFKNIDVKYPENKNERKTIERTLTSLDLKIHNLQSQNQTLEKIAQTLFKQWFVDFNFPDENGNPYKDSGGEMVASELGEIPKGWRVEALSKIIDVRDGTHASPKQSNSGFPLVTSKHLKKNGLDFSSTYLISEADYHEVNKRSKVERYDILLSMIGTVGTLYYVMDDKINFAIKNIGLFKTSHKLSFSEYIYLFFNSTYGSYYFKTMIAGTTQSYLTLGSLREFPIIIPELGFIQKFRDIVHPMFEKLHSNNKSIHHLIKTRDTLLPKLMSGKIRVSD